MKTDYSTLWHNLLQFFIFQHLSNLSSPQSLQLVVLCSVELSLSSLNPVSVALDATTASTKMKTSNQTSWSNRVEACCIQLLESSLRTLRWVADRYETLGLIASNHFLEQSLVQVVMTGLGWLGQATPCREPWNEHPVGSPGCLERTPCRATATAVRLKEARISTIYDFNFINERHI